MTYDKGFSNVQPSRCRGWHYINPSNGARALCGRGPIRLTYAMAMKTPHAKAFRNKQRCDYCDTARRK